MKWNLALQADVEALEEDNKQLRAAVSIYSEVARRSPAPQFRVATLRMQA